MRDIEQERAANSERAQEGAASRAPSQAPRKQIGPYQLITKIGEGGMGTVWLANLTGPASFHKVAVLKELRADLTSSPTFVEMFLNEARLAARLTHPNVVHTYGANEEEGRLYIAMEYLDGQSWSALRHALWSNQSLPLVLHLKVLADVLSGLHYAHELRDYDGTPLRVVHRDVSPQNVFVTYDGQVKVVDFGVAYAVNSQNTSAPASGPLFVGKVAYSSPEQLRGDPVDRRSDVYSVGVMLWEALAGRRLNEGSTQRRSAKRNSFAPRPPIHAVSPSTPPILIDICDRALSIRPEGRFATAAEFRDELLRYLDQTSLELDIPVLGQMAASAFEKERARINGLIERTLMQRTATPSVPTEVALELVETLPRPADPAEHTPIADLSAFVSVSKLQDDNQVREASQRLTNRGSARGRRALAILVALLGLGGVAWLGLRMLQPHADTVIATPLPALVPQVTEAAPQIEEPPARPKPPLPVVDTALPTPVEEKPVSVIRKPAKASAIETLEENTTEVATPPVSPPAEPSTGISKPAPEEPDFDTQIEPEVKPRPIYEEDPY